MINIYYIAKKLVKTQLRSPITLFIYLAFPIILITILGTAFSGSFGEISISGKVVVYSDTDGDHYQILSNSYHYLEDFDFVKADSLEEGKKLLQNNKKDALVEINNKKKELKIYYNKSESLVNSVLDTFIETLFSEYDLTHFVISKTGTNLVDKRGLVEVRSLENGSSPGALDYYGITMMTMIIMYGAYISAYAVIDERKKDTFNRMLLAPVKGSHIFWGISIGSIIQIILQTVVIIIIGSNILNINYGDRPIAFFSVIISQIIMVVSMGLFLATIIKDVHIVDGVINIAIPVMVFLAGGYFVLPDNPFMSVITRISPVYWVNKGVFESIYSNNNYYIKAGIYIPIGCSLLMLLGTVLKLNRGNK